MTCLLPNKVLWLQNLVNGACHCILATVPEVVAALNHTGYSSCGGILTYMLLNPAQFLLWNFSLVSVNCYSCDAFQMKLWEKTEYRNYLKKKCCRQNIKDSISFSNCCLSLVLLPVPDRMQRSKRLFPVKENQAESSFTWKMAVTSKCVCVCCFIKLL